MLRANKYSTLLILTFILVVTSCAKNITIENPNMFAKCGGSFDLCGFAVERGYKPHADRSYIIPPTYQKALDFHGGLAGVKIDGKWGYINGENKVVIKPKFDRIGRFNHGLAEVLIDQHVGVINTKGKFVLKPQFYRAIPISDQVLIIKKNNKRSKHYETSNSFDYSPGTLTGGGQLYHLKDGWLTNEIMRFGGYASSDKSTVSARREFRRTGGEKILWGVLNFDGTWAIEPTFEHGANVPFEMKLSKVSPETNPEVSVVKKDGKKGVLDRYGNLIGGRYFDDFSYKVTQRQPHAVLENGTWLYIAKDGTLSPDVGYTDYKCENGFSMIRYVDKVDFISPNGQRVGNKSFDVKFFSYGEKKCDEAIWVRSDEESDVILPDGTLLSDKLNIENGTRFKNGLGIIKTQGKWGLYSVKGDFVIAPEYDKLDEYGEKYYVATKGETVTYFTQTGEILSVPDLTAENLRQRAVGLDCNEGAARLVLKDSKWGMVDKDGNVLIKPIHPLLTCYSEGVAWVPNDEEGAWCPIGPRGNRVKLPACRITYYPSIWSHHFPEIFDPDPYKSSVIWNAAALNHSAGLPVEYPKQIPDGTGWGPPPQ